MKYLTVRQWLLATTEAIYKIIYAIHFWYKKHCFKISLLCLYLLHRLIYDTLSKRCLNYLELTPSRVFQSM